jgi:hypothetical protein
MKLEVSYFFKNADFCSWAGQGRAGRKNLCWLRIKDRGGFRDP